MRAVRKLEPCACDPHATPASQVTVRISGIPTGVSKVLIEHFRIDDTHSNAFTVWKSLGSPQDPTPEQYTQLKAAGQLQTRKRPEFLLITHKLNSFKY